MSLAYPKFSFETTIADGKLISFLTDIQLMDSTGTFIAFTTRSKGYSKSSYSGLNLSLDVGDDENAVMQNRQLFFQAVNEYCEGKVNAKLSELINPKQVHKTQCLSTQEYKEKVSLQKLFDSAALDSVESDGVLCNEQNVPVMLLFADCVPIIAVTPNGDFVVIHSGWRGCFNEIVKNAINKLQMSGHQDINECNFYIGPHIEKCCFETSTEICNDFIDKFGQSVSVDNKHIDLTSVVTSSLLESGASQQRIVNANICTVCNNQDFFSYRAQDKICGRHAAFAIKSK